MMFGSSKVEIKCPCGKVRQTITIRRDTEKHSGTMVCAKCRKRFAYQIIGTYFDSWYV